MSIYAKPIQGWSVFEVGWWAWQEPSVPCTDRGCLCCPCQGLLCLNGGTPCYCSVPTEPSRTMVPCYLKQVDSHSEYVEYKIFFLTRNYLEARQSRCVELKVFVSPTSLPNNRYNSLSNSQISGQWSIIVRKPFPVRELELPHRDGSLYLNAVWSFCLTLAWESEHKPAPVFLLQTFPSSLYEPVEYSLWWELCCL